MTRATMAFCVLATTMLLAFAFPATANAVGSNGGGGATGEQDDWPCAGCVMRVPPGYDPSVPTPLLVTFHGDEGDPGYIHGSWDDVADAAGVLLLSLECPRDLNCGAAGIDGSWWQWRDTSDHDPLWVGEQVDQVEDAYNVELQQVYLSGFSGGSSYLSTYGLDNTERFAGLVYLGGGFAPWNGQCEQSCLIPTYFLIGGLDFLLDNAQGLRDYLTGCGHEVEYEEVPGVEHEIIRDRLPAVLQWLLDRPHLCREEPPDGDTDGGTDTGNDSGASETGGTDVGDDTAGDGGTGTGDSGDGGSGSADDGILPTAGDGTGGDGESTDDGCGCRATGGQGGVLLMMVVFAARRQRLR